MTYARLLIPYIFQKTVSRILYLDADILVLGDLRPLWSTDLHGAILGAVPDRWAERIKLREPGLESVPLVREYFNAGVLLVDLNRWRDEQVSEKALKYLARHPQSPFSDQDALNAVCDGYWARLNPRWNSQNHGTKNRLQEMSSEQRPIIVHFSSSAKPWKPDSLSPSAAFYDSYRNRTCFARTPLRRMLDTFRQWWLRAKPFLMQYSLFRAIHTTVRAGSAWTR
jgi:lipopolysaccharide biosynthesis glycosyltransferase